MSKEGVVKMHDMGGGGSQADYASTRGSNRSVSPFPTMRFQDDIRAHQMIKQLQNLEEQDNDFSSLFGKGGNLQFRRRNSRNILQKLERMLLNRLFQINHVLLSYQTVNACIFHLVLLFEFLQLLFFIFYKVAVVNEFAKESNIGTNLDSFLNNSTAAHANLTQTQLDSDDLDQAVQNIERPSFRIDYIVSFVNFQVYAITSNSFIAFYWGLSCVFIIYLALLFGLANKLFQESKMENLKEWKKLLILIMSLIMSLYLFLLQVPFMTTLMQGYKCEEDPQEEYIVVDNPCDSQQHKLLIVFSTLTLFLYIIFQSIQQYLFISNDFDTNIPWATFDKKLVLLKFFCKFLLTGWFILDKSALYQKEICLTGFFLSALIVQRRCTVAKMFNRSVYYASLLYEVLAMWFFLMISMHEFSVSEITIVDILFVIVCGLISSFILVCIVEIRAMSTVINLHIEKVLLTPEALLQYFFKLFELIESDKNSDKLLIEGIFIYHIEQCTDSSCQCLCIAQSLEGVQKFNKLKESLAQESQTSQNRLMRESSLADMPVPQNHHTSDNQLLQLPITSLNVNKRFTSRQTVREEENPSEDGLVSGQESNSFILPMMMITQEIVFKLQDSYAAPQQKRGNNQPKLTPQQKQIAQFFDENTIRIAGGWNKRVEKKLFKFLAQLMQDAIDIYPKNVDLKLASSFIYKSKLDNEFKAVFELMNCEQVCQPTIFQKFIIFRRKQEIEQILFVKQRQRGAKIGYIDVFQVFNYEKYCLKYQIHEYLTVLATISFWKELLQKTIDATNLRIKGQEISQNFHEMQDIAMKAQSIYPDEIRFLFRYGAFLMNIINNEGDALALFTKAQLAFQNKLNKKGNSMPVNEQTNFGENTASGIIMISATSTHVGTIIHANDELEHILGYTRKDLIGKNIKIIMPLPIAQGHDRLIKRYFDTAKPTVIEIKRSILAIDKEGYIRIIELLVKINPQINNKIIFIGTLQSNRNIKFEEMDPPKAAYESNENHYLITDTEGYICNVSEGLRWQMGLHARFFQYGQSIFKNMINLRQIAGSKILDDPETVEALEQEGLIINFDTSTIIDKIEMEALTSEEIIEIRSNIGKYQAYVQLKKFIIEPKYCQFWVFRIIPISKVNASAIIDFVKSKILLGQQQLSKNGQLLQPDLVNTTNVSGMEDQMLAQFHNQHQLHESAEEHQASKEVEMALQSSIAASSAPSSQQVMPFIKLVKDFKKTLNERRTPRLVKYFNRLLIFIIVVMMVLTSITYHRQVTEIKDMSDEDEHNLKSESRTAFIVQLAINIRSLVNVGNHLEFDSYEIEQLSKLVMRFEYLGDLVQEQQKELSEIHEFMTQQRVTNDAGSDDLQNKFEYEPVTLYRLEKNGRVSSYTQPYRVALQTLLNQVLLINQTTSEKVQLPSQIFQDPPTKSLSSQMSYLKNATEVQKAAYFIMVNGLRSLRTKSRDATVFQQSTAFQNVTNDLFVIILCVAVFVAALSTCLIIYQIWLIEATQGEIISLYAHLSIPEISQICFKCNNYLIGLNEGNLIQSLMNENEDTQEPSNEANSPNPPDHMTFDQFNDKNQLYVMSFSGNSRQGGGQLNKPKASDKRIGSGLLMTGSISSSTVSREAQQLKQYQSQKQSMLLRKSIIQYRSKIINKQNNLEHGVGLNFSGIENYTRMIKCTISMMHELNQQEEISAHKQLQIEYSKKNKKTDDHDEDANKKIKKKRLRKVKKSAIKVDISRKYTHKQKMFGVKPHKGKGVDSKTRDRGDVAIAFDGVDGPDAVEFKQINGENNLEEEEKSEDEVISDEKNSDSSQQVWDQDNDHPVQNEDKNQNQMTQEEMEMRKQQFMKTITSKTWTPKIATIIIALAFSGYFIWIFFEHQRFLSEIDTLHLAIPVFFNRFRYLMLSFGLLRERIILNNSLESFEEEGDIIYGHDIDLLYNDLSTENEKAINQLKSRTSGITSLLSQYYEECDSQNFCSNVLQSTFIDEQSLSKASTNTKQKKQSQVIVAFQHQVTTVFKACIAAYQGDIKALNELSSKGIDLSVGDYDLTTPLHLAVRANQIEIVKYLVQQAKVNINAKDRWGSTPLNYAIAQNEIQGFLIENGATNGTISKIIPSKSGGQIFEGFRGNFTENDARGYYAAKYGDLKTLQMLRNLPTWNNKLIDYNGRNPLHVAVAEGQMEVVKYLVASGVDLTINDNRGNIPSEEADINGYYIIHEYLEQIVDDIIVLQHCESFSDGIFKHGLQSAISNFRKRFSDLQIKIRQSSNYPQLMSLLQGTKFPLNRNDSYKVEKTSVGLSVQESLKIYFQSQELYFFRVMGHIDDKITQSYQEYCTSYEDLVKALFTIFLLIQIATLVILRRIMMTNMKEDIIESRGILNLIPNNFFDQNRQLVESIMKKIKQ